MALAEYREEWKLSAFGMKTSKSPFFALFETSTHGSCKEMSNTSRPFQLRTTAILAGGAASRLGGRDKGLVGLLGRPLIAWTLEALALVPGQPRLIVANRNLDQYARFAPTISDKRREDFAGPLAGVAAALDVCATTWLYTVPVDCVRPRAEILEALWAASMTHEGDVVVAHDGTRRQPLFALYRSTLAASAERALAEGAGVMRWQDSLNILEIDLSALPDDAWLNLNTPEDLALMTERMS